MQDAAAGRAAADDERQPVGQAAPALRHRRRRPRRARATRASTPERLTLEITETVMMTDTDLAVQRLQRAQGARRAAGDGRLRHRLLVAELPQPLPGRHPQDGPLVPARRRVARGLRPRHRRRRARRDAEPRGRRRGHRVPRAVDDAARPRLRARPGLLLRPADGRRRDARVPARRRSRARRPTSMHHSYEGARPARAASAACGCSRRCATATSACCGAGMCVSLLGDGVFLVAMAWQVYALSNAPTALALVGIAMTVPTIAFLLLGGVRQRPLRPPPRDARRRRRARRSPSALLAVLVAHRRARAVAHRRARRPSTAPGTAFFGPAFDAIVPEVLPAGELAQANALDQFVRPIALRLAGPGARRRAHRASLGAGAAFALDAASFVVSARRAAARWRPRARAGAAARGLASRGDIARGLALRPPPRVAVGDVRQRRDRLPAVHGPGRGAAALHRQERPARQRRRPRPRLRRRRHRLGRLRRRHGPARAAAARHHLHVRRRGRWPRSRSPATASPPRSGS